MLTGFYLALAEELFPELASLQVGWIRGRVFVGTYDGAYANVLVMGKRLGAVADERGIFSISTVPAGVCSLRAMVPGSDPLTAWTTVRAGETTFVELRLPAPAVR